jgi:crotonobetainyl-CoA:carnitine CoA-transferase CaiB-like acyl-CoA transferase
MDNPTMAADLPLSAVRVLDLATGLLAAIGRHLAELGADVIRVEPPGGAFDRARSPSIGGVALEFVAANFGKRAVVFDPANPNDRRQFETLLATVDILIEASEPGSEAAAALDIPNIRRRYPGVVILSVTGFGRTGAYSRWQATGPVLHALSGELSRSGIPGRAPLLPPGNLALDCAIPHAVFVLLLAYMNRLKTGAGDWLDFALLDGASQALDPGYGIAGSATAGVPPSKLPRGRPEARFQYPIIPCADGYVRVCVLAPRQWQGLFEWMGRPEEFADAAYNTLQRRFSSRTLIPAIARFFAGKTRVELEEAGQSHGVPIAAVLTLEEALATDQIRSRRAFVDMEIVPGVRAPFPDGVVEIDGQRAGIRGPAPRLVPDSEAAPSWIAPAIRSEAVRGAGKGTDDGRPLTGLRVMDLGVIVVGAEQGRLLADQGADVVKLENAAFPDGSRQTRDGSKMSVTFAAGHRNKKGLGLNLRDPQGQELFLRLVEQTDVILSNFKPGTLQSLGLDYARLAAINPRIIMVDSSAFGPTGPWSSRLGYGPLVRASAGLTAQWRYPAEEDSFSDAITVYPDHVASRIGAAGALALIIRRQRTGRGGTVSISQAEVMLSHMAQHIASLALERSGHRLDRSGPAQDAPWGVFPCAGDDEWCVVTVRGDSDWQSLCGVIERPDLLADSMLTTAAGRDASRDPIDEALGAWLRELSPRVAMERLQAAGVPAGAMLRVSELPQFPYFQLRGLYTLVRHPLIADPFYLENATVRSERLPDPAQGPAPMLGEHTLEIARDRLGLSPAEIERLVRAGVLEAAG